MTQLSRDEYKERFLSPSGSLIGKRSTITVTRETKNKLRQLCTAADGRRISTGWLVERIIDEHCTNHRETIEELYQRDIPY